jgi:hypothetical protein
MSYRDLVVLVGEGTTVGGTGILTVTNNSIAAGDIAVANLTAAGATVVKIICVTNAGSATFTVADVAGAAVAVAVGVNFVILRPSNASIGNGF